MQQSCFQVSCIGERSQGFGPSPTVLPGQTQVTGWEVEQLTQNSVPTGFWFIQGKDLGTETSF